jgi:arsenate reductase
MSLKVYEYKNCSTCQKAVKWLEKKGIRFEKIAIVDQPPSVAELKQMLKFLTEAGGTFKNLFNTSGVQYRELKIADKIKAGLTEGDALALLAQNGKLIKRPFAISKTRGTVGFKEDVWKKLFTI